MPGTPAQQKAITFYLALTSTQSEAHELLITLPNGTEAEWNMVKPRSIHVHCPLAQPFMPLMPMNSFTHKYVLDLFPQDHSFYSCPLIGPPWVGCNQCMWKLSNRAA